MSNFKLKKLAIYELNESFVKFMRKKDSAFYSTSYHDYSKNTFKGLIFIDGDKEYFVPIIPGKQVHMYWKKKHYDGNFLITEPINKEDLKEDWFYQKTSNPDVVLHILCAIRTKKMFPVPKTAYKELDIYKIRHKNTKHCLEKALEYYQTYEHKIINSINHIYKEQMSCNYPMYFPGYYRCNYRLLESIIDEYDPNVYHYKSLTLPENFKTVLFKDVPYHHCDNKQYFVY